MYIHICTIYYSMYLKQLHIQYTVYSILINLPFAHFYTVNMLHIYVYTVCLYKKYIKCSF